MQDSEQMDDGLPSDPRQQFFFRDIPAAAQVHRRRLPTHLSRADHDPRLGLAVGRSKVLARKHPWGMTVDGQPDRCVEELDQERRRRAESPEMLYAEHLFRMRTHQIGEQDATPVDLDDAHALGRIPTRPP